MEKRLSPAYKFSSAMEEYAPRFNIQLSAQAIARLREYYEQVMAWNKRLHLVAPCSPAEFATRHVLESLLAVDYMYEGASVADVGSGAGLPIIPCLIVRSDINATLFESSKKKAIFLREALSRPDLSERAEVIAERFEKMPAPQADFITCRALERLTEMFKTLVNWSPTTSTLLIFGGEALRKEMEKYSLNIQAIRIPESERRFLFIAKRLDSIASK
ncbi:MAG TPA: 16S rRNA (guanine(527)-N(7))-methyltransferase RsmG [Pyrinomonadaceae bacterium]|nr:16S rRNA (guanine(527)-N(7))-methyltransferase RsmG [Pyrinomonadaceae bacterium]